MKQELFNNKTKAEDYQRQPKQLGLYEASHEHDACGVGMLVNIQGGKSHELVESALKVLEQVVARFRCEQAVVHLQCPQLADGHQWNEVHPESVLQHWHRCCQVQRQHQQHDLEGWE